MRTLSPRFGEPVGRLGDPRAWVALAVFIAAYVATPVVMPILSHRVGHLLQLRHGKPNELTLGGYGVFTACYLLWSATVLGLVALALGRSVLDFPVRSRGFARRSGFGLATGLVVMLFVMLAIWMSGAAAVTPSGQPLAEALRRGGAWLILDYVGAAGEETFNRAALYLAVASLLGWRAAALASGLLFLAEHMGNPGASPVWLLRIGLQGVLLAYAVHRTQSIWWSIGYHTGWNWISAPLFGAAGSGYMDEGHVLDFAPHGPTLITGGAVGPEGSLFAFVAVLLAFAILIVTTGRPTRPARRGGD